MELRQRLIQDIESLPEDALEELSVFMKGHLEKNSMKFRDIGEKRRTMFGCMKNDMSVSDDFDARSTM